MSCQPPPPGLGAGAPPTCHANHPQEECTPMNEPIPLRKDADDPFAPEPATPRMTPLMQAAYWLVTLLALVILGEFVLVFVDALTGTEARDLFMIMGLPILVLFGCVLGFIVQRSLNERP